MQAHPFSFGKHHIIPEWELVASPAFMNELDSGSILRGAMSDTVKPALGEVRWLEGYDKNLGRVDIAYRHRESGLLDHAKRKWHYVEGLIFKGGNLDPNFQFTASHFDQVQEATQAAYDKFFALGSEEGVGYQIFDKERTLGNVSPIDLEPKVNEAALKLHGGKIHINPKCPPVQPAEKIGVALEKVESIVEAAKPATALRDKASSFLAAPKGKMLAMAAGAVVLVGAAVVANHFYQKQKMDKQPQASAAR